MESLRKNKSWFIRNWEIGAILLLVSGLAVYSFRPFFPPPPSPQTTGIIECIRADFFFTPNIIDGERRVDITVFTINGVEYFRRWNNAYRALLGKEVTIRHSSRTERHRYGDRIRIFEMFYDGKLVTKPLKNPLIMFIPASVVFALSLFWCWRTLITKLKLIQGK